LEEEAFDLFLDLIRPVQVLREALRVKINVRDGREEAFLYKQVDFPVPHRQLARHIAVNGDALKRVYKEVLQYRGI